MPVIFLLVSFFSSLVGAICGIGGGVIIKPVLDATGTMSVTAISFFVRMYCSFYVYYFCS